MRAVGRAGRRPRRTAAAVPRHPPPRPGRRRRGDRRAGARRVADEPGCWTGRCFFHDGWVPYDERDRWLAAADDRREHAPRAPGDRVLLPDPGRSTTCGAGCRSSAPAGDELAERVAAVGRRRGRAARGTTTPSRRRWPACWTTRPDGTTPLRRRSAPGRDTGVVARGRPAGRVLRRPRVGRPDLVLGAADRELLGVRERRPTGSLRVRVGAALREGGLRLVLAPAPAACHPAVSRRPPGPPDRPGHRAGRDPRTTASVPGGAGSAAGSPRFPSPSRMPSRSGPVTRPGSHRHDETPMICSEVSDAGRDREHEVDAPPATGEPSSAAAATAATIGSSGNR